MPSREGLPGQKGSTPPTFMIGEAAAQSGCTPEGIRYYEREGVVPAPTRGGGNYRRYRTTDIDRLRFVRRARALGFSLNQVRSLLTLAMGNPTRACADVDRMARAHLADVNAKLAQLAILRDELEYVINACPGGLDIARCRILGGLAAVDPTLAHDET